MSTILADIVDGVDDNGELYVNGQEFSRWFFNNENMYTNGTFEYGQRRTTFDSTTNANGDLAMDEHRINYQFSNGSLLGTQETFPVGTKLGMNTPRHFYRMTISGTQQGDEFGVAWLRAAIEKVDAFNEPWTLLGWARSAYSNPIVVRAIAEDITADRNSIDQGVIETTTDWQPFAVPMNVYGAAGLFPGPFLDGAVEDESNINLNFWIMSTDNESLYGGLRRDNLAKPGDPVQIDLWGLHTRMGTWSASAAPAYYIAPSQAEEYLKCARYYQKSYALGTAPGAVNNYVGAVTTYGNTGALYRAGITVPMVPKFHTPVVTTYSPETGTSGQVRVGTSSGADVASSVARTTTNFRVINNATSGTDEQMYFHWAASATCV